MSTNCTSGRPSDTFLDFFLATDDEDTETDKRPKSRPGMLAVEGRAKYDAWKDCQDMSKQDAMNAYVALAKEKIGSPVEDAL